jgi:hypothetical protein
VGCEFVEGWAKATLRVKDENTDISYVSSSAKLRFKPRASPLQDAPGATHYDLMPTSVIWTAAGHEGDCTISGQIVINIPSFENQPLDLLPTRPAHGYLNVVGLDSGDFHSVMVRAMDPKAVFKKTCPDPVIIDYGSPAAFLLHIIFQPNTYEGPTVAFKGTKIIDMAKPTGFLDLMPPGAALDVARQALGQAPGKASGSGSQIYTGEWELRPLTFGQTAGN